MPAFQWRLIVRDLTRLNGLVTPYLGVLQKNISIAYRISLVTLLHYQFTALSDYCGEAFENRKHCQYRTIG